MTSPPTARTSSAALAPLAKLRELTELARFAVARVSSGVYVTQILAALDEYERHAKAHLDKPLAESRVMEIGFGARPLRLIALLARGVDAWGIDIDPPALSGSLTELAQIRRTAGAERALKSALRFHLLDRFERANLRRRLGLATLTPASERFIVGDATGNAAWTPAGAAPFDLIISEDVFEHIPPERLPALCTQMAAHMAPRALALIRPNIFTGIAGGHLAEWFAEEVNLPRRRRAAPWEHLRARRFKPNTYLNEWNRQNYRDLFTRDFEIVEESQAEKALGRRYLTPEIRAELTAYSDEDLFSNAVLFVLKKKPGA